VLLPNIGAPHPELAVMDFPSTLPYVLVSKRLCGIETAVVDTGRRAECRQTQCFTSVVGTYCVAPRDRYRVVTLSLLPCICLMAGVRLVKRDVRPSHDVTSDRHANLAHPAARVSQYDKTNTYHSSL
jgi:hypothetical protein